MPRRAARLPVLQCLPPQASLDDCLAEREYRAEDRGVCLRPPSWIPPSFLQAFPLKLCVATGNSVLNACFQIASGRVRTRTQTFLMPI